MLHQGSQRRGRKPSPHQKQIRFFTGLLVCLIIIVTIGVFLLINWNSLAVH